MQKGTYIIEEICDFDTAHIFDCGQCFRWQPQEDGSYTGIAGGKIVNMRFERYPAPCDVSKKSGAGDCAEERTEKCTRDRAEEKTGRGQGKKQTNRQSAIYGRLVIDNCSEDDFESFWRHYLDLDRDYGKIKRRLSRGDAVMRKAVRFGQGIRILNQDLWEVILSFIISQNNNIPRIKGCIEKLAELLGEEAGEYGGKIWYSLPSPERLAGSDLEELAPVKLGYRAKYLLETARKVCEEGLPQCRDDLADLCGVGPKVASCIALFGMNCSDSFPIDVWVARVMHRLYGLDEGNKAAMAEFARTKFGSLGGFAQQYLFYYMRETQGESEK